jgi:hypothetical protein
MPAQRKQPQRPEPRRAPSGKTRQTERTVHHPLYGEIPLVEVTRKYSNGQEYHHSDYDRDFRPPMPEGAVRGDLDKQHFCPMCHFPRYFYVDQERSCVECGRDFVFSASEQKFWYEDLKFHFDSVAIRCQECRRKQRTKKTLNTAVARAKSRLAESPLDAIRALAVAEALVRLMEHTGEGDLNEAIALARKARRSGDKIEGLEGKALFWEGKAQALLERHDRAEPLFRAALETLPGSKGGASLRAEAEWYLNQTLIHDSGENL